MRKPPSSSSVFLPVNGQVSAKRSPPLSLVKMTIVFCATPFASSACSTRPICSCPPLTPRKLLSSQETPRWREVDSNSRSRRQGRGRSVAGASGFSRPYKPSPLSPNDKNRDARDWGTEGSNPPPSSGESPANLSFRRIEVQGRSREADRDSRGGEHQGCAADQARGGACADAPVPGAAGSRVLHPRRPCRIGSRRSSPSWGPCSSNAWLDANCGADGWTSIPASTSGVVNDAIAICFADAALASAFVARWCAMRRVEIVDGVYHVRDDEPTPRVGAALHKTP
jgi:hypothetical protein